LKTENHISMRPEVIKELTAVVGPDHLLTAPQDRWRYAYDAADLAQSQ
jgi:hypothetical protein